MTFRVEGDTNRKVDGRHANDLAAETKSFDLGRDNLQSIAEAVPTCTMTVASTMTSKYQGLQFPLTSRSKFGGTSMTKKVLPGRLHQRVDVALGNDAVAGSKAAEKRRDASRQLVILVDYCDRRIVQLLGAALGLRHYGQRKGIRQQMPARPSRERSFAALWFRASRCSQASASPGITSPAFAIERG